MKIDPRTLSTIKAEWSEAGYGKKTAILKGWAGTLGVSMQTLYRWIVEDQGHLTRPTTVGGGELLGRGNAVTERAALAVLAFKERFKDVGGRISTKDAIEALEGRGIIPQGMAVTTINKYIRELRMKQGIDNKPCVRMEATYPNEVWHIDFTVSKLCVAGKEPGTVVITSDHAMYKRPRNEKVWVCGVVDAYSRCVGFKYYLAQGESARLGITHLTELFKPERNPRYPFGGIPDKLVTDNGAFGSSALAESFCTGANIEFVKNAPYQKQANGKIERAWRTLWSNFEGPLAARIGEELTIEELNHELFEWEIRQTNKPHPVRPNFTRLESWARDVTPYLRYATGDWAYLPVTRTVRRDMTVTIDNIPYKVNARLIKRKIEILMGIKGPVGYRDPDTGQIHELEMYEPVKYGEFRGTKKTAGQKALEEMKDELTGIAPLKNPPSARQLVGVGKGKSQRLSQDEYPTTTACIAAVALKYSDTTGESLPDNVSAKLGRLFESDRTRTNVEKVTNVILNAYLEENGLS